MNKNIYSNYLIKYLVISAIFFIVIFFIIYFNTSNSLRNRLSENTAKAIVLSCIDFRFVNDEIYFLNKDRKNNFNLFSLAGASLGYNQNTFPEWGVTFDKHVELSKQLHDIDEIIVIDHMDCGAYRILYHNDEMTKEEEYELHTKNLNKFKTIASKKFPSLKISTYLTQLDGSVKEI
jgi:carbonic anhydrase